MRKRLIEKFTKSKEGSFGYTMTELLVVVAIIAIVAAIAIPSVIAISRALKFKRVNDHAKSIFLAAQQNLTEMRSDGGLKPLRSAGGSVLTNIAGFPEEYKTEYLYTSNASANTAFELILPAGSVDGTVRAEQIIIEYNPITGNVYSVFYSEEDESILGEYQSQDGLPRNADGDKSRRKDMMLGYYDGSGLNSSQLEIEESQAMVEFVNGEEGIVRVLVPVPDDYFSNVNEYAQALKIDLTITGEYSMLHGVQGAAETGGEAADPSATTGGTAATVPAVTIEIKNFGTGLSENVYVEYGNVIVVEYPIDSLMDKSSFANYAAESRGSTLTNLMDESSFKVLPGENVTIQADVEMDSGSGDLDVVIEPGILSSVNPMFDFLQPSGDGGYILAVSNGRNLQNLNAIAPTIAELVDAVVFTSDIYWNDTVSYYNDKYDAKTSAPGYQNDAAENPARALPYFVPIHHEDLFGTARFIFPGDESDGGLGSIIQGILNSIFGGYSNKVVPTLTDEVDNVPDEETGIIPAETHANIQGNGHKVYNLNIDSTKYAVPNEGKFYATGGNQLIDYYFSGLFGYVNTPIDNLHVVNPIVKGRDFDDKETTVLGYGSWLDVIFGRPRPIKAYVYGNPATGALLGAGGFNTLVTNCSTYIDKDARGYIDAYLYHGGYSKDVDQKWYGVSGEGAVGGLVGYAKSHRSVTGELTDDKAHLAFSKCFAAVPVTGNMRSTSDKHYGYSNGVGAFIGNSQLTNFYNCYASGNVIAQNVLVTEFAWKYIQQGIFNIASELFGSDIKMQLLNNGRKSWGAGGFVGTSHGTRYTNCFATGDVDASAIGNKGGAGGFVGFMSIDETFKYGNESEDNFDDNTIAQRTVFTNCYSVGRAVTNTAIYENFSGANGRIAFSSSQFGANLLGDYYRLYAPYYVGNGGEEPEFEGQYIYRDTYFMSGYTEDANIQSGTCAEPEPYSTFEDLVGNHSRNTSWTDNQIKDIKDIVIYRTGYGTNRVYHTYETEYFDKVANDGLTGIYRGLYDEGYSANEWNKASTTHPYSMPNGSVYPFTKLAGLEYYGDWPSKPSAMGLAYYEAYQDEPDKNHFFFDREHEDKASLHLNDGENVMVVEDGYAIFSANNAALTVTVNGVTDTLAASGERYTVSNNPYHVFYLSDKLMEAVTDANEFYTAVTAQHGNGTSYTMYFNPGVAISHVNPTDGRTAATKPDAAPKSIYVRSARQFKAIAALEDFWGKGYSYIQQLNIDAVKYSWADAERKVSSIGNAKTPFNASYSAGYTVEGDIAKQYKLSGFLFDTDAAGFFGTIGKDGSIENLIVECDAVSVGGTSVSDVAVLAGRNEGTISNVDMVLENLTTLTAADNAGLLAGYSSGTVRDCEVSAAAVTVNAKNGGGLIGSVEGTANAKAKVSGCKLTLTGDLTVTGTGNAGGLIGQAKHLNLTATEPLVTMTELTVDNAAYAGGLAGWMEDSEIKITDAENAVTVTADSITNSNNTAAGVLGSGTNVTANGVDVTVGSVSGKVAAGFLGTGTNVDASFCDVVIKSNSSISSISGTEKAAGMAGTIGPQSVFNLCTVTLTDVTVSATADDTTGDAACNAAGYAVEIAAEAEIRNSSVTLGGSAKIEASNNAAGYACTVAGYVGNASGSAVSSSVVGEGTITGKNAAGFACDITGQVASSFVTPALAATKDAYRATDNSKLNVSATGTGENEGKAAGFALNVGEDATVTNCYALNQITGASMTGFVGINKGSIDRCMTNVTISGGNAFVATNDGTVTRCYGWYGDGKADTVNTTAEIEGSGKVYSAYFVDLDIPDLYGVVENAPASVVLYGADGKLSDKIKSTSALRTQGINALTSDNTNYTWIANSAADEFPYSDSLKDKQYEYPMLRAHYGDWVVAPSFAYGVAYYETYKDGSIKVRIDDRSNHTETIEEKSLDACVQIATGKDKEGKDTLIVTPEANFDPSGEITKAGYAIFSRTGDQNSVFKELTVGDTAMTTIPKDVLNTQYKGAYSFYELTGNTLLTLVGENGSAAVDLRFANAIADKASDFATYIVRTPEQLAQIGNVEASFSQTHDIVVPAVKQAENAANIAAGKTYAGDDPARKLTFASPANSWLGTVSGTVNNLTIEVQGNVSAPVVQTIADEGTVSLNKLIVTGNVAAGNSIFGTVSGKLTGVTETTKLPVEIGGTVSGSLINTVEDAEADVKIGNFTAATLPGSLIVEVKSGTVATGTVSVDGTVGNVFGTVGGTVTVGTEGYTGDAIKTGAVTNVFGNVTGGSVTIHGNITTGAVTQVFGEVGSGTVTVNGDISVDKTTAHTGKIFDDVKNTVNVTGRISLGEIGANGQVFGAVTAPVTVSGGITTNNGAVNGQVFGAIDLGAGETVNVGGISVGNIAPGKSIIPSITGANATNSTQASSVSLGAVSTQKIGTAAQGETGAKTANIFGNINGGTVTVASINTNGKAVYGNVFGEINGTVNVGTVDTAGKFTGGPITTGAVTGNVFGDITSGTVTSGTITTGALSGNVFGDVSANVTTESITAGMVTGDIFGNISNSKNANGNTVTTTVTTGAINVASLNGKLANTVGGTLQGSAAGTAVNIGENGTADLTQDLVGTVSGSLKNYAVKAADVSASVVETLGENGAVTFVSITADSAGNAPVLVKSNGGNIVSCTVEVASVEATDAAAPYGVMADQVKAGKKIESSFVKVGTLTIDGNTAQFGALVGTNAGTLTGNTVGSNEADNSLALNVTGVNDKEPVIGGLVGTNASTGTISGGTVDVAITYAQSNTTDDQGNVTATDKGATIGGLVGENSGTIGVKDTVTNVKGAVNLTKKNDGQSRAYIIGGAVGKDAGTAEKPATYSNVSTTVAIDENWAGAKLVNTSVAKYLAETDADAIAAICPAGFGPVGKFVGYVGGGSFNNCSAVGSKTTKAYQFLGEIKPDTADLQQDSLYLSVEDYKDSFPLESAPNLCAPGVTKAWTEWVTETILKAGDDYRVFGITLNNCSFDLTDGSVANQVYKPNYDFYKLDNYAEVKLFKSGAKVENNIRFTTDAGITADSLYAAYKPDSKDESSTTNSVDTAEYNCYYNDGVTYKKVTSLEVTVERSRFILWWYENKHTIALKNGTDTLVSVSRTSNDGNRWSSWGTMGSVYTVSETVPSDTSYVLLSEDGTKMMAVVGGVATSVDASTSFEESGGYLWKRANDTFTSATHDVTLVATLNLSADSYNSTTQAYVIGGVPYYLHAYTEASHGYTATFVPSGESNMVCGYNVVPAAPAALSEENEIPAEEIGGETGNNT